MYRGQNKTQTSMDTAATLSCTLPTTRPPHRATAVWTLSHSGQDHVYTTTQEACAPSHSVFTITPQHESIYASMRTQGPTCHTLQNTDTQVQARAEPDTDSGQPHLTPHTHPSQDARAVGRRTHGHRQGTRTLAQPIAAHTRGAGR